MANVAEILQSMQSRFNPKAAAGLDLVFQFKITDAENYYLVVKEGTCDLQAGEAERCDVALIMDKETIKGLLSGEISGMQAFMSGRVRTEGNMMLALKLNELFPK
ncbi:putative sterol carrier protein [Azomonas agilis]|uniref:Putative sterol carrier protein n=1 Tax=Azomonas agilis TaxID=116849 RepID=A0A562I1Y5_9GAMM|nr:SCP2 sterol-binding domain-containing protein [Azomonas agilis]TWH64714.1 putative sterol carrier protein [Azomonas agilis]